MAFLIAVVESPVEVASEVQGDFAVNAVEVALLFVEVDSLASKEINLILGLLAIEDERPLLELFLLEFFLLGLAFVRLRGNLLLLCVGSRHDKLFS